MTLAHYIDAPYFVEETDLHTTDGVALLWDDAAILDMASLAPRDVFQAHADHRLEFSRTNPLPFWRGGFRYRAGYTTLAVVIHSSTYMQLTGNGVTPRIRVYVNEVLRIDQAITAGTATYSIATMAAWGLVDGAVAEVRMDIVDLGYLPGPDLPGEPDNPSDPQWGRYELMDAFVGPVSSVSIGSWPGVPTFSTGTGEPDPDLLLQLSNASDWLAARMALVPQNLFQRVISSAELPYFSTNPGDPHMWSGGGPRGPFDRLAIKVVWLAGTATSHRIRLLINGTEVDTTADIGAYEWGEDVLTADLSGYTATAVLRLTLELVITAGADPGRPTRVTTEYAEYQRTTPGFQAFDNRPVPDELTTWETRALRLNAIGAWLQVIKNRIDNDVDRWDRVRLFRSSYAYDPGEARTLMGRFHAVRRRRTGARLIVRGSNLKLGYGPYSAKLSNDKEPESEYVWSWGFEEGLVSGDQVETREIYLDALPGLDYGMQYTIYGDDVRYAAEEQR
jgi:hypothetical protein